MGGVFLVRFVITIPSLIMVLKPLHARPPSPCEKVGGTFFLGLSLWVIPLGFVGDVIFKVFSFYANFNIGV